MKKSKSLFNEDRRGEKKSGKKLNIQSEKEEVL
jgi:hypothetical protein